jgi:hypothetical protein
LTTEYEQLLGRLLEEKRARLAVMSQRKEEQRKIDEVLSEIRYIELEIEHYQRGLALFRSKSVPKVGRWGKPESEEHSEPATP